MENLSNRISTSSLELSVMRHYAQTEEQSTESHDGFCNCSKMSLAIPEHGLLLLMGGFNAKLEVTVG